jgi:hypothetical protein
MFNEDQDDEDYHSDADHESIYSEESYHTEYDNEHDEHEDDDEDEEYDEDGNLIPGPGRYIPPSRRIAFRRAPCAFPRPIPNFSVDDEDHTLDILQGIRDKIRDEYDAIRIQHDRDVEAHIAVQAELATTKERVAELSAQLDSAAEELHNPAYLDAQTAGLRLAVQRATQALAAATQIHDSIHIPPMIAQPPKTGLPKRELDQLWTKFRSDMDARKAICDRKTAARTQVDNLNARLQQAKAALRAEEHRVIHEATLRCEHLSSELEAAKARVAVLSAQTNAPDANLIKMDVMKQELDDLHDKITRFQRRNATVLSKDFVEEYDENGDLIKKTSTKCIAELHALDFNPPMKVEDGWEVEDNDAYAAMRAAILAKYPEPEIEKPKEVVSHKQTTSLTMADFLKFKHRGH